jgi:hypothetical protein
MLQRLSIAVVLCAAAALHAPVVSPQIPGQGGGQQHNSSHDQQNGQSAGPSPCAPTAGAILQGHEGEDEHDKAKQEPGYWKQAFGPANAANWGLVGIDIVAGLVALFTLGTIKRQADLMQEQMALSAKSLEALQRSTDAATIAAEDVNALLEGRKKLTIYGSEPDWNPLFRDTLDMPHSQQHPAAG